MSSKDFDLRAASVNGPAYKLVPVSPDDDVDFDDGPTRAIFVGQGGRVAVRDLTGRVSEIVSADSQYHPIRICRVLATNTDASDIIALY